MDLQQHVIKNGQFSLQDGQAQMTHNDSLYYYPSMHHHHHFFKAIGFTFRYAMSIAPPSFIASICHCSKGATFRNFMLLAGPLLNTP